MIEKFAINYGFFVLAATVMVCVLGGRGEFQRQIFQKRIMFRCNQCCWNNFVHWNFHQERFDPLLLPRLVRLKVRYFVWLRFLSQSKWYFMGLM